MRLGESLLVVVWFVLILPTASFVRMRLSSPWQRRLLSATFRAAAVTSFRSGKSPTAVYAEKNIPLQHFPTATFARTMATSTLPVTENPGVMSSNSEHTDYEKWVRRLYMTNLFHPVKMGLDNVEKLHELVGTPMDDVRPPPPIHFADTFLEFISQRKCLRSFASLIAWLYILQGLTGKVALRKRLQAHSKTMG